MSAASKTPARLKTTIILKPTATGSRPAMIRSTGRRTSARNIQEVIEGGNVSLFGEDRQHPGPRAGTFSPFEKNPEDYAYGKLEAVPTESLEQ